MSYPVSLALIAAGDVDDGNDDGAGDDQSNAGAGAIGN